MIKVDIDRQLMISVENKVGSLAEITSVISSSGINLVAICAYEVNNNVSLMFVTADNNEARLLLEHQGYEVREEEVVLLTIDNKPGALQHIMDKIALAGIGLKLIYGSVDPRADVSRIVIISDSNLDISLLIKTEIERS